MTYAQARDLTYGSHELRPHRNQRRLAAAAGAQPTFGSVGSGDGLGTDEAGDSVNGPGDGASVPGNGLGRPDEGEGSAELSEMALKPGTESVRAAREFTAETLRGWDLDGLIEDAVIIASELVTNAIKHGAALAGPDSQAEVELAWQRFTSRVTCVVTDGSSRPPVLSAADMSAESGRGLQVVHALAAAWGWMMVGAREKAVWATLVLPPPAG